MFGLTVNPLSTGIDSLASDSVGQGVRQRAVPALMLYKALNTKTFIRALVLLQRSDQAINPTIPFRISSSES